MVKNQSSVFMRVIISIGIIFFIINSVFFYLNPVNKVMLSILFFGLICQIILGVLIFVAKNSLKKGYQIFLGFIFIGWGMLNLLFTFVFPVDRDVWWPLYLVISSIFLLITGYLKYKKFKFGYVIPGFTLFCMGIWFSLFSFDIVKIPFKVIVLVLGPAFILFIGLIFILFFLAQQRHKKLVFSDEDSGDFGDEDLSFPKLD